MLDKNKNFNILLAGILSIIISIGIARFAFTTLLPSMLDDFLSVTNAGLYASFNYAGYLSGALFSVFIKDINSKVRFFRFGVVLVVVTTFILGVSQNETLWYIARLGAGFGSAMMFIVGSSIVMLKLDYEDKTKAMGIYFTGIGFGIVVTEILGQFILQYTTWDDVWVILSIVSLLISFYIIHILSFDKEIQKGAVKHQVSKSMFTPYVILLIAAYFTAGVGFVVQATFLPDIVNSLEGLEGYGSITWLMVGVAGIPSAIIWMRLAHRFNSVDVIIVTFILQIIGILIPAMTSNIYMNLLSGVLYGSTFIAHVALFMHYGGKLAGKNPVVFMGSMTAAYGIGQVVSPLYSVALYEKYGTYDMALYVTAFIVSFGIWFLIYAKGISKRLKVYNNAHKIS